MVDNFVVNIDSPLAQFDKYIQSSDKCILSAKFGDGKTYFLNKFKNKVQDDYIFITLYPINYQVVENKDVFELIKYDILVQMIANQMIKDDYEISFSDYYSFYLMNNKIPFLESLLSSLQLLNSDPVVCGKFLAGLTIVKNILSSFSKFKKEIDNQKDAKRLLDYINSFKDKSGPFENDPITKIITDNISSYREKNKKNIALVIEDLDRLDPAHIFRILNVLSAHIDREYQLPVEQQKCSCNKFGFDKILLVCDFNNIECIYKHIYGEKTDFEGYIRKFMTREVFHFSLKDVLLEEIYSHIEDKLNINRNISKFFFSHNIEARQLENLRIRSWSKSIFENIEVDIKEEKISISGLSISAKQSNTLKFFALLKRMYRLLEIPFKNILPHKSKELGADNFVYLFGDLLFYLTPKLYDTLLENKALYIKFIFNSGKVSYENYTLAKVEKHQDLYYCEDFKTSAKYDTIIIYELIDMITTFLK